MDGIPYLISITRCIRSTNIVLSIFRSRTTYATDLVLNCRATIDVIVYFLKTTKAIGSEAMGNVYRLLIYDK